MSSGGTQVHTSSLVGSLAILHPGLSFMQRSFAVPKADQQAFIIFGMGECLCNTMSHPPSDSGFKDAGYKGSLLIVPSINLCVFCGTVLNTGGQLGDARGWRCITGYPIPQLVDLGYLFEYLLRINLFNPGTCF